MQVGLALSAALTLFVAGMALWIVRRYVDRLADREVSERRSGLLPAHVVVVSSWSVAVCIRMTLRDQYVDHAPPTWLGWPLTVLLVLWLMLALLLIVVRYAADREQSLREQ